MPKYVAPSISLTAFNCPHCGVLTSQFWSEAYAANVKSESKTPGVWLKYDEELIAKIEPEQRKDAANFVKRSAEGQPFYEKAGDWSDRLVVNLNMSRCMDCSRIAIWVHDDLIWPLRNEAPEPNADLPEDVRADFIEAGLVLSTSPRSAAALLRQAVQRLCKSLGEKGRDIDADIASLVKKGLDPRVQQALDVVRVIGNNAVHPGQIDIKDDRATAEKLFGLVNLISDVMISQPKHIAAMFDSLPDGARQAIEKRDASKPR